LGKIHLGVRVTNNRGQEYPKKTDYFVVPDWIQQYTGAQPKELRIMFPTENPEQWASTFYRAYSYSLGLICKGDGERATRLVDMRQAASKDGEIPQDDSPEAWPLANRDTALEDRGRRTITCPGQDCPDYASKACRQMMMLQFLLPDVPGLGIWQIDTSSFNSIKNVYGALELIRSLVGRVSLIPLTLKLEPLEITPKETNRRDTVYVLNLVCDYTATELLELDRLPASRTAVALPEADDEVPDDLVLDQETQQMDSSPPNAAGAARQKKVRPAASKAQAESDPGGTQDRVTPYTPTRKERWEVVKEKCEAIGLSRDSLLEYIASEPLIVSKTIRDLSLTDMAVIEDWLDTEFAPLPEGSPVEVPPDGQVST